MMIGAVEAAARLRDGSLSARGLLDRCLERIERLNPVLNAIVHLDAAGAALAADAAEARLKAGRALGPIDGVPVVVKDNLLVAGLPATWGSRVFEGFVPDHDEVPVARLRAAGAVIVGKTNTPEFSLRGVTDNPVFGATRNPWDPSRTPGGSSGGAVAAVASGMVPLALATDGGGSIRRPAAHTGLVGFKPGNGRIPRADGFPALMFDCEVVGPIARTVADARALFEALAIPAPAPEAGPVRVLAVERLGDAPVDPGIALRFREAAAQFAALGCEVSHGALPFDIAPAMAAWAAFPGVGFAGLARAHPGFFDLAAPDFVGLALEGAGLSGADYVALVETLLAFRARTAQAFERVDVILTPATAAQPWPVGQTHPAIIAAQPVGPRGHAVYTGWVNACGHPAIAIPVRPHDDGLPVGVQMVGQMGSDERLLDLAARFEAAHPWAGRWPQMAP